MADAFDLLDGPVTTDKGTIFDYPASSSEAFAAQGERQWDTNPFTLGVRSAGILSADLDSISGKAERVDQATAQKEVAERGLDLKIPVGGLSRYELDVLKELKQREIKQNITAERTRGLLPNVAGFSGGLAASLGDPVNIASNFIPFVPEARYARWLANAGTNRLARAAVRVGAGAIEGAAGAAVVEPLVYAGATSQQLDYSSADSFLNVTFGGVLGGGLHTIGGAVHDYRASRALATFSDGLSAAITLREKAPPDHVQQSMLQQAVQALETEGDVRADEFITAWHGSPHTFDKFDMSKIGSGEGAQAFGHGLYFAEHEAVARSYRDKLTPRAVGVPQELSDAFGSHDLVLSPKRTDGLASQRYGSPAALLADLARFPDIINDPAIRPELREAVQAYASPGSMYEVRLGVKSDELLDWDKPLSEQPKGVKDVLSQYTDKNDDLSVLTAGDIVGDRRDGSGEWVTYDLKKAGIKGIRYLDGNSRAAGQGTRNFVIFDDKDVQIVSRNGERVGGDVGGSAGLSGLIPKAKAERTSDAFNRQFVEDGTAPPPKAEPKDKVAAATEDAKVAEEALDEFRAEGRVTDEDEALLEKLDVAVKRQEIKAKAIEAAAACMVTS